MGGTSVVASVRVSSACWRVRRAPRAERVVMFQVGVERWMGSWERVSKRESVAGSEPSALGFGGAGGEGFTSPSCDPLWVLWLEASSMLQCGEGGELAVRECYGGLPMGMSRLDKQSSRHGTRSECSVVGGGERRKDCWRMFQ